MTWQYIKTIASSESTLLKKKRKFSLYLRIFIRDRVQSHIWPTASSYMVKYLRISSYIRKPFLIYDFVPDPFWIPLNIYEENFLFFFSSAVMCSLSAMYGLFQQQNGSLLSLADILFGLLKENKLTGFTDLHFSATMKFHIFRGNYRGFSSITFT